MQTFMNKLASKFIKPNVIKKKCFLIEACLYLLYLTLSYEKSHVNPRSFPFHRLSVEAHTLESRLEKGVCSSRSICSENWEKNSDRYRTCPEYFAE